MVLSPFKSNHEREIQENETGNCGQDKADVRRNGNTHAPSSGRKAGSVQTWDGKAAAMHLEDEIRGPVFI
jgi:hypothetical protein